MKKVSKDEVSLTLSQKFLLVKNYDQTWSSFWRDAKKITKRGENMKDYWVMSSRQCWAVPIGEKET